MNKCFSMFSPFHSDVQQSWREKQHHRMGRCQLLHKEMHFYFLLSANNTLHLQLKIEESRRNWWSKLKENISKKQTTLSHSIQSNFSDFFSQITAINNDILLGLLILSICFSSSLPALPFPLQPSTDSSRNDFSSLEWSLTFSSPNSVTHFYQKKQKSKMWKTVRGPAFPHSHTFLLL